MVFKRLSALVLAALLVSCDTQGPIVEVGKFQAGSDLFLAQFDSKTDVDDIHSIAAVATMLNDPRLSEVHFHAVAGAYGTQGGKYVPANELFDAAFGRHWSDAHADFEAAVAEVSDIVAGTLNRGGDVWIAEAGQSDFTAAVLRVVKNRLSRINTGERIHVVQHSSWNEGSTTAADLDYVKKNSDYNKIPDGNAVNNGTPGFRVNRNVDWRSHIDESELVQMWEMALGIANNFNGKENRYNNVAIARGGMDFSDAAESCWIFGFEHLADPEAFFAEFSTVQN